MEFKGGVVLRRMDIILFAIMDVIDRVHKEVVGREAICTSAVDSNEHKAGSMHYVGRAYDLRTRDLTPAKAEELLKRLREVLGVSLWDVIMESDHIHVEFQPYYDGGSLSV
jgi:hypothetical protein